MQKCSLFKVKGGYGNKTKFEERYIVLSATAGCMLGDTAEKAGEGQKLDQQGLQEPSQVSSILHREH